MITTWSVSVESRRMFSPISIVITSPTTATTTKSDGECGAAIVDATFGTDSRRTLANAGGGQGRHQMC